MGQFLNGREIITNDRGQQVYKDQIPVNPIQGAATELGGFMGGVGAGFNRGSSNLAETVGLLDESAQRDLDFSQEIREAPVGTAVGQLAAGVGAGIPLALGGAGIGAAIMARLGFGAVPTALTIAGGELAGGAAGSAATAEGDFTENFLLDAAGGLFFNMASRVGRGIFNVANDIKVKRPVERGTDTAEGTRLVDDFQEAGGALTPGQAAGSPGLSNVESAVETTFGGGPLRGVRDANQSLLTRKAAESIGLEDVDELSGPVLDEAREAIGRELTSLADSVGDITIPADFPARIRALADPTLALESKTKDSIEQMARQAEAVLAGSGKITPQNYMTTRQTLNKNIGTFSGDSGTVNDLEAMFGAVDELDQVLRGAVPDQADDILDGLASARERYRNWIALSRGDTVSAEGLVSPAKLATSLSQVYGNTFKQSAQPVRNVPTGELFDLARGLATKRMKPTIGSSGTAERAAALAIPSALLGAGGFAAGGDVAGMGAAALPLVAPGLMALGARAGPLSDLGSAIQTSVGASLPNLVNQ